MSKCDHHSVRLGPWRAEACGTKLSVKGGRYQCPGRARREVLGEDAPQWPGIRITGRPPGYTILPPSYPIPLGLPKLRARISPTLQHTASSRENLNFP